MPLVDTTVYFRGQSLQVRAASVKSSDTGPGAHIASAAPDGRHIAILNFPQLHIYERPALHLVREITLPSTFKNKSPVVKWAPPAKGYNYAIRFLVNDRDTALVFDLEDVDWSATINYGNHTQNAIANADFGLDEFEVITYPRFGAPLTVWSLYDGTQIDIKDPKFPGKGAGFSRRGRGGVFALLRRIGARECISIHIPEAPEPYTELHNVPLGKSDAMGLKWSPDGKLFAIWQAARNGYEVSMHSAEGHHLRTYKSDYFEDQLSGLGISNLEWDPTGRILAVGAYERSMTLLKAGTLTAAEYLYHRPAIKSVHTKVFVEETAPPTSELPRHYQFVERRPYALPVEPKITPCISSISFNCDGTVLATRDDSMPTCAWIWSLTQQSCIAVLVQLSAVKSFAWHPSDPNLLLIQVEHGANTFYTFDVDAKLPNVMSLSLPEGSSVRPEVEASWLPPVAGQKASLMLSDKETMALAYPSGKTRTLSSDDRHDGDDSLFEILSGSNHVESTPRSQDMGLEQATGDVNLQGSALSAHWREVGAF